MVFADVDSWPAPMPAEWSDDNGARHEFLDWICLAGTMTELGRRFEAVDFVESHLFNSSKCFGVFPPA